MPFFASCICFSAKLTAVSSFDHVGIIIECTDQNNDLYEYGELYLLEANMGGVTLHRLNERLNKTKAKSIAIRQLTQNNNINISTETKTKLWDSGVALVGSKYDSSMITMTAALFTSYLYHGQNSIITRFKEIENNIALLQKFTYANPNLENLVRLRIEQLEKELLKIPNTNKSDNNYQDRYSKYFCSSLVSDVLRLAQIQKLDDRKSNLFVPADFSSASIINGFHTVSSFSYSDNIEIKKKEIIMKKDTENGVLKIYINSNKMSPQTKHDNTDKDKVVRQVLAGILTACPPSTLHPPVINNNNLAHISKKTLSCALQKASSIKVDEIEKLSVNEIIDEKYITVKNFSSGLLLVAMKKFIKK